MDIPDALVRLCRMRARHFGLLLFAAYIRRQCSCRHGGSDCPRYWGIRLRAHGSDFFPAMAPEHKGAAISAHNLAAGLSNFMGPTIATLAISSVGVKGIVWIYASLYLVGVVLTYFIHVDQPGLERKGKPAAPVSHHSKTSEAI
ncbi:hypothetical protein ACFS3C_08005 [Azotobacter vinelandii]